MLPDQRPTTWTFHTAWAVYDTCRSATLASQRRTAPSRWTRSATRCGPRASTRRPRLRRLFASGVRDGARQLPARAPDGRRDRRLEARPPRPQPHPPGQHRAGPVDPRRGPTGAHRTRCADRHHHRCRPRRWPSSSGAYPRTHPGRTHGRAGARTPRRRDVFALSKTQGDWSAWAGPPRPTNFEIAPVSKVSAGRLGPAPPYNPIKLKGRAINGHYEPVVAPKTSRFSSS